MTAWQIVLTVLGAWLILALLIVVAWALIGWNIKRYRRR